MNFSELKARIETLDFLSEHPPKPHSLKQVEKGIITGQQLMKQKNLSCKNPMGRYSDLKSAMNSCVGKEACIVLSESCDAENQFRICNSIKDLKNTTDDSCVYIYGKIGKYLVNKVICIFSKIYT